MGNLEDLKKPSQKIDSVKGSIITDGHFCEGITCKSVLYGTTTPSSPGPPHY